MRRMRRVSRNYLTEYGLTVYSTLCELLVAALGGSHELIDLGGGQVARIAGKSIILSHVSAVLV